MIRALITAALIAGTAMHFGADPTTAAGYALVLSITLWFLWPPVRTVVRMIRRRRRHSTHRTPARTGTAAPQLTQINHHHHYYYPSHPPAAAAASAPRPDYTRPALPLRSEGQRAHDAIYRTIIDIDETP